MPAGVADRIKQVLSERGLQQKHVARRAHFSPQQFSDMLHGRKVIRADYLPSIAEALGVEISALFPSGEVPDRR